MGNHHSFGPTPEMATLILASKLLWHGYSLDLIHSPHPQIIEKNARQLLQGIAFSTVTTWKLTAPFKWKGTYEWKYKICRAAFPEMNLYGYGTSLEIALIHILVQIYLHSATDTYRLIIDQLFNSYYGDRTVSNIHPKIIIYNWGYFFERVFGLKLTRQKGMWQADL